MDAKANQKMRRLIRKVSVVTAGMSAVGIGGLSTALAAYDYPVDLDYSEDFHDGRRPVGSTYCYFYYIKDTSGGSEGVVLGSCVELGDLSEFKGLVRGNHLYSCREARVVIGKIVSEVITKTKPEQGDLVDWED